MIGLATRVYVLSPVFTHRHTHHHPTLILSPSSPHPCITSILILSPSSPISYHPPVFVLLSLSAGWDANYHHFLLDSLTRLVRHLDFLRANPGDPPGPDPYIIPWPRPTYNPLLHIIPWPRPIYISLCSSPINNPILKPTL